MKRIFLIVTSVLIWSNSFGQNFHEEVSKVYNFFPHKMTREEQEATFPRLDNFYNMVIKDKKKYIEPLRGELKRNDNNPYFYFSGGMLLLKISQDKNDIQLVADALVKSDLRDLPPEIYLEHILALSIKGANVIDAVFHILDDTTFTAFFPKHVLTLEYADALNFILPRYSPDLYIDKLISKFYSITSTAKKENYLFLFLFANCCEADNFINSLATDNMQAEEIRNIAALIIEQTPKQKSSNKKQYTKLFENRKKILTNISDEALLEATKITMKMRKMYECDKK